MDDLSDGFANHWYFAQVDAIFPCGLHKQGAGQMSDFILPTTRYAVSGEVNIAYQTMGDGPIDIVLVPGIVSHVEFLHEFFEYTAFLRRLSKFARVVTFDKRGQGLSDRISGAPALEERMDDLRAIMDAIGSQRAAILGVSEGSAMSALFAATYPERVIAAEDSPRILISGPTPLYDVRLQV